MIENRDDGRVIEITVRIDADPGAVWKAITRPEEIKRWFPLDARGDGWDGGRIEVSWGDDGWWGTTLTVPDPGRHARFVDESTVEHGGSILYMDYHLETDGGTTVVRFVHSGFGPEDRWDEYLDGLDAGWSYFFRNLKVYLEHHAGTPRTMIWSRPPTRGTRPEIFRALTRALNLPDGAVEAAGVGDAWSIDLGDGPVHAVLEATASDRTLGLRLPDLDQSLLFLEIEKAGDPGQVGVWISTYDADPATETRLRSAHDAVVSALEGPTP